MTKPSWTILLVGETAAQRAVYRRYLQEDPVAAYRVWEAERGTHALVLCLTRSPDCIVLSTQLPDFQGGAWLAAMQAQAGALAPPVILLREAGNDARAVEAWHQGAQDSLVKASLTPDTLCRTVRYVIEHATTRRLLEGHRQHEQARAEHLRQLEAALHQETAARQRAEEESRRLQQIAQQGEHFAKLGRLAAGVSHEIRHPLATIFLYVDLLEEELGQPTRERAVGMTQCLTEIRRQLARLAELVEEYLSLVRVASIQVTPQDLGVAVQTWAADMQELAAARGVTLQCEPLLALGQAVFHPSTLRRAVLNLVLNAIEAMPRGGRVTLAGDGTATHFHVHVRDTGSGIPAAQLEQIFEPLYTTKPEGTGLGLYIVQEIMAAHGGQVTVASVEGQGTTFTLTLPVVAPA